MKRIIESLIAATAVMALCACTAVDRLEEVGSVPALAPIGVSVGPTGRPLDPDVGAVDVIKPLTSAGPQIAGLPSSRQTNSLWQAGASSFFHDPRANRVGDLLTVRITIADTADLSNTTERSRKNSDDATLNSLFGLDSTLATALPSASDPKKLVDMGSNTSNTGTGSVSRKETINMTLAALVTTVLPNGNLVIGGHQQVRVNNELRDLQVTGIVRKEDITNNNTIDLAQIAEARISYGGRGTVSDVQQPRYGSQVLDILMPW
jgi:flagellar L-ring protein precursor FlgH